MMKLRGSHGVPLQGSKLRIASHRETHTVGDGETPTVGDRQLFHHNPKK
ncbi:MAG TPA: hypothetical protein VK184_01410 [Nostocaceae cyanobacterium]|nr:hypothetical protein [Nostocaceae cyanobacterium]